MKNAITILSLILLSAATLHAQNIDREEMNRDINILEGVLGELFKAEWSWKTSSAKITSVHISEGNLSWNFDETTKIEGTYLPSYGVLFTISGSKPIIYSVDTQNEYYFTNGNNQDEKTPVNEETIENRIIDFLKNYGSTITQLDSENKITVIYKAEDYKKLIEITNDPSDSFKKNRLPTVTVTVSLDDIKAYQADKLGNRAFRNRLQINSSKTDTKKKTDLKILANILDTAFEGGNNKQFEISSAIEYEYIDGFGALYSFDTSYGGLFGGVKIISDELQELSVNIANEFGQDSSDIDFSFDSLRVNWEKGKFLTPDGDSGGIIIFDSTYIDKMGKKLKSIKVELNSISDEFKETNKKIEEARKKRRANIQQALDQFVAKLKKYVIDYGPTLKSLSSNQYLMMSINISTNADKIPERLVLQVKKSVLGEASRNEISREQAMEEITVREY